MRTTQFQFITLFACSLLAGCSFAPKYTKPSVPTPSAFKEVGGEPSTKTNQWKSAVPRDHVIRGNWWKSFDDARLNALEEEATAANQTISAAMANFFAARALVKQARSDYFPIISTSPSVTRSRQSSDRRQTITSATTIAPFSSSPFTSYVLPLDASWELDLWGRVRNTVKANSLQSQASLADLENVRLTVQAEVAADYFQLRALDEEKQLLDAAVLAYQESVRLTQARYETGIASDQDVAQAQTQLNSTAAQATDLAIQRARMEHAVALLVGKPASVFSIAVEALKSRPTAVPSGVPSDLLERRPDVAAAERRVAAANASIGVARAAYFPAITLTGSVGYQSLSLANLVSGSSLAWSVGASLAETLFDAGKRRAITEQARANYLGTVANYRQTVLTAFQETEDNLSTLRLLVIELKQQETAVESSRRYLDLATYRYKLGIDSYLNIIVAQTALLGGQRTAVNLRTQQMAATVQLIKALGGGWDATRLDTFNEPKISDQRNDTVRSGAE